MSSDRGVRSAERVSASMGLALVRVAALPVIFAGERLVEHPSLEGDPFNYVFAATTAYAILVLITCRTRWAQSVPGWLYAVLDFVFISALAYASGGAFSQLRFVFFVLPVGAAFLLRPALTAAASVATVAAYVAISLSHPGTKPEDFEFVLTQALSLAWMGLAAVALSYSLTRREERIEQLAADRGRLVAEALDAEDRERRRLAEALHDEAIQNLLAARQDLKDAELRNPGAIEHARRGIDSSVSQLRAAVFDLHPYVLEQAGLAAAVQAVAAQQERLGGFEARVRVDPEASGIHDQLMLSLARELLSNAAKHAAARSVSVTVSRHEDRIVLEVEDDGRGIDQTALTAAVPAGHIGLASCAGRVEAVGGSFEISQNGRAGTRVRADAPVTSS